MSRKWLQLTLNIMEHKAAKLMRFLGLCVGVALQIKMCRHQALAVFFAAAIHRLHVHGYRVNGTRLQQQYQ